VCTAPSGGGPLSQLAIFEEEGICNSENANIIPLQNTAAFFM
jgi:hypothetical protein